MGDSKAWVTEDIVEGLATEGQGFQISVQSADQMGSVWTSGWSPEAGFPSDMDRESLWGS